MFMVGLSIICFAFQDHSLATGPFCSIPRCGKQIIVFITDQTQMRKNVTALYSHEEVFDRHGAVY